MPARKNRYRGRGSPHRKRETNKASGSPRVLSQPARERSILKARIKTESANMEKTWTRGEAEGGEGEGLPKGKLFNRNEQGVGGSLVGGSSRGTRKGLHAVLKKKANRLEGHLSKYSPSIGARRGVECGVKAWPRANASGCYSQQAGKSFRHRRRQSSGRATDVKRGRSYRSSCHKDRRRLRQMPLLNGTKEQPSLGSRRETTAKKARKGQHTKECA